MAFVDIEPPYRAALSRGGLLTAQDFLDCPGVILSGHPRRHVLRVWIDGESCILKKEHHVRWRDRLANVWAGFGWSSKSVREARVLTRLRDAHLPCPQLIAAGEDGGRAFLLLREQAGMTELRDYLARPLPPAALRALAVALGRELARMHAAGFAQPDLYAKHILVQPTPDGPRFCFIDWQRSRQRPRVAWRQRLADLARLDASLAEHLASDRVRLACLYAYLTTRLASGEPGGEPPGLARRFGRRGQAPPLAEAAAAIRRTSDRLLKRRKIRELRQPPLPDGAQSLLWLEDGERLCIARDFYEELGGRLPSWLPRQPRSCQDGGCIEHRLILLGNGRTARLVERWRRDPAGWLRRGKFPAPEFAQASTIFRLQRFGVAGPRLLAMGFHSLGLSQRFSFLLSEPPLGTSLEAFLTRDNRPPVRHRLLRQLGARLRQVHEAGYMFRPWADPLKAWIVMAGWTVCREAHGEQLVLAGVEMLDNAVAPCQRLAAAELWRVLSAGNARPHARLVLSRSDRLRVVLGYWRRDRLDSDDRAMLLPLLPRERQVA